MPKIRNKNGEDRYLPWLGGRLVLDGQVVEVPESEVYNYTQQAGWDPVDEDAKSITEAAAGVAAEVQEQLEQEGVIEPPPDSASRDEWAAYAMATGQATEDDLNDDEGKPLGRNAIRDQYKPATEES